MKSSTFDSSYLRLDGHCSCLAVVLFHFIVLKHILRADTRNVYRISCDAITPVRMPLGIQRLNAKKTQPNDRVVFIKPLKGKDEAIAQDFLERIAAQCRTYFTQVSTRPSHTTDCLTFKSL